jgi:hypothetical protein
LPEQFGAGAAEEEESCGERASVGEHPQHREQVRPALDFVDDDRAAQRRKRGHRLGEPGEAGGILEVEETARVRRNDQPCQRGLAGLPGSQERNDAAPPQGSPDPGEPPTPFDHRRTLPENRTLTLSFHGLEASIDHAAG